MSFILDALKKSERKRPPGPVPDLFTVQGPLPPGRRRLPTYALPGAIVLAALVAVGGWAWWRERERQPAVQPAPTAVQMTAPAVETSPPAAVIPAPPVAPPVTEGRKVTKEVTVKTSSPKAVPPQGRVASQPRTAAIPQPQSPAAGQRALPSVAPRPAAKAFPGRQLPMPAVPQRPVAVPTPPRAPFAGAAGNGASISAPGFPAASPVRDAIPSQPPPSPVPVAAPIPEPPAISVPASVPPTPDVGPVDAPASPAYTVPASVPTAPGAGGTISAPATPAIPPSDNRIVGIEEAPESVRSAIRNVGISGHIWSEDPALRLLTVQNRIVRQGAEAAPGVRVEEITPDGAVLISGGWRVRVAGF